MEVLIILSFLLAFILTWGVGIAKNRGVAGFFLGLILGWIGFIVILLVPGVKNENN